jgi:hypothetical protein
LLPLQSIKLLIKNRSPASTYAVTDLFIVNGLATETRFDDNVTAAELILNSVTPFCLKVATVLAVVSTSMHVNPVESIINPILSEFSIRMALAVKYPAVPVSGSNKNELKAESENELPLVPDGPTNDALLCQKVALFLGPYIK